MQDSQDLTPRLGRLRIPAVPQLRFPGGANSPLSTTKQSRSERRIAGRQSRPFFVSTPAPIAAALKPLVSSPTHSQFSEEAEVTFLDSWQVASCEYKQDAPQPDKISCGATPPAHPSSMLKNDMYCRRVPWSVWRLGGVLLARAWWLGI